MVEVSQASCLLIPTWCVQADRILSLPAVQAKAKQLGIALPEAAPVNKPSGQSQDQLAFGNRAPRYTAGKPSMVVPFIFLYCASGVLLCLL